MAIPEDLLDALTKDYKNPEDLIGKTCLLKQLTNQLLVRAMQAEMTEHLGYEKNAPQQRKRFTIPEMAVTASESRGSSAISILPSLVIVTTASSRSLLRGNLTGIANYTPNVTPQLPPIVNGYCRTQMDKVQKEKAL